jgi:hypothetical protein
MKNQENVWFQESMWFQENGHGLGKILILGKISRVAHGKSAPWEVIQKCEYLEHMNSEF